MKARIARIVALSVLAVLIPAIAARTPALTKTTTGATTTTGAASGAPAAYTVAPSGEVVWSQAGGPWRPLREGQLLNSGDKIRTGTHGAVSIMFAGGTVARLDAGTTVEIRAVSARGWTKGAVRSPEGAQANRTLAARLYQSAGRIWVHVVRRVNSVLSFEVETPAAVAGVRGTIFTVAVASQIRTTVSVWEGVVDVKPSSRPEVQTTPPVRASEGQEVHVEKGKGPVLYARLTWQENELWKAVDPWLKSEEERSHKLRVEEDGDKSDGKDKDRHKGDDTGSAFSQPSSTEKPEGESDHPDSGSGGNGSSSGGQEAHEGDSSGDHGESGDQAGKGDGERDGDDDGDGEPEQRG